ncbi:MAG: molybdopterin-dependent oxidoreductase, partial [Gammaproteobacteria bacterium]|nr:molybdopterin-dependent oxidoreductase [Gammaproteobacteria bacterium]
MRVAGRRVRGGVGESVRRPDGVPKVTGRFAYVGDLHAEGMLWGATRRVYVPHGRITRIDITPALAMPGVQAVLTQDDVPGFKYQGQIIPDQPVLAEREVRYWGEPIVLVAAESRETARAAADIVIVDVEPLEPLTSLEEALDRGEVYRHMTVRRGDADAHGTVVVEGYYETPNVDQAPLGTEAGVAIPDGSGGVDLYPPSQWIHVDHEQLVRCLALEPEQVRVHPTGLGGAFGSREDLSLHTHLCMLALRTGRPVKMVYSRFESFAGHVKRHSAHMWYRHESDEDGNLVRVDAKLILDGGAYANTTNAVLANAVYFTVGPYRCPNTFVEAYAVRTNNPPSGAMRGFGANQVCFAHEAQMDRLAAALSMDPLDLRLQNALKPGDHLATTGQEITEPLPTAEVLRSVMAIPLPDDDSTRLPGRSGLTSPPSALVRGVGYAIGIKNLAFSEGFDDYADARVELTAEGARVHTAASEVGQGMVTVLMQIARSVLTMEQVEVVWDDTAHIGSAGSTSASRQTQMAGGAVQQAALKARSAALERVRGDDLDDEGVWRDGRLVATWAELCESGPIIGEARFRHPDTDEPDENGQGNIHVDFCVAAHRAIVDVDTELGLVRVVRIDTAQDVGRALNPVQVIGQIEGGTAQGFGMALLEEVILDKGVVKNPTFTDYLLPTIEDVPPMEVVVVEQPSTWGPFGAKGFAELPAISSTPAVVAAIRAATGREINRVPVHPE